MGVTLCFGAGEGAGVQTPGEYGLVASRHEREGGVFRVNYRTGDMSICYVFDEKVVCTPQTSPTAAPAQSQAPSVSTPAARGSSTGARRSSGPDRTRFVGPTGVIEAGNRFRCLFSHARSLPHGHPRHPDPEAQRPDPLMDRCLIGGEWVGQPVDPVDNPATGEILSRVPNFGAEEAAEAVEKAEAAFKPWSKKLAKERSQIMRRWFDLMIANKEDIALIMTSEQGKPLAEARGEVDYAASFVEFYAEEGSASTARRSRAIVRTRASS